VEPLPVQPEPPAPGAGGLPPLRIEERLAAEADAVIAESPQDEEDLITLYDADPARPALIPCGFDPEELAPVDKAVARVMLGLDPEERIVLHLGRLVPRKGVDNVIRGAARLRRGHYVSTRLVIVGGETDEADPSATPEIARLRRIAAEEDFADAVTFAGRRGRGVLRYFYSAADVFVTTPWYEPFGITPVEAMACGTPVVGSNVGGVKSTVRDGLTGYLVPPDAPDELAERLARLYRFPALAERMAVRARRRAQERFTWARVADEIAGLYQRVLARTAAEAPTAV
jgi:glycosyltransferase involved in cell wall biosynthesis